MQAEHQEHLGGPASESFHRRESFDHVLVRQRIELVELQPAIGDPCAEITEVADLLSAQPDRSQGRVALPGDRRGVSNMTVGKQRDEPAEDRRGRFRSRYSR